VNLPHSLFATGLAKNDGLDVPDEQNSTKKGKFFIPLHSQLELDTSLIPPTYNIHLCPNQNDHSRLHHFKLIRHSNHCTPSLQPNFFPFFSFFVFSLSFKRGQTETPFLSFGRSGWDIKVKEFDKRRSGSVRIWAALEMESCERGSTGLEEHDRLQRCLAMFLK